METAKGIVDAASKMVFGENQNENQNETQGQEPKSGQLGEGTADKPYDAGNATGEPSNKETSVSNPQSGNDPAVTEGSREPKATSSSGPSVGAAAPESGAKVEQKQQGADRPNEEPQGESADAIASKKEDAENAMSKDEGDASGDADAGPKPLGGGGESKGGQQSQKDELGSTSKEPGTGTQYVKSSGLAAEGGDFDATKPGAGKEADRLLEEKGIHHEGSTGPPQDVPAGKSGESGKEGSPSGDKDKPSIGQKIKDKLHIGKKS